MKMRVKEIAAALPLEFLSEGVSMEGEVYSGYVSDLLSNAMSQAEAGTLWVTMQGHQNIIAVASLVGMSGIIVSGDAPVDQDTISKAKAQEIPLFRTALSTYAVAGKLHAYGVPAKA